MAAEDLIAQSQQRLESLLAPIDGGVGADATYDERFEAMKAEVDKLTSMSGGKVDWGSLVSTGDELLSDVTKDFRVAVYYAAAKAHTDGLTGLLDGFVLVRDLDDAFWEAMYPALRRPKARGNLVSWWSDVVTPLFEQTELTTKDNDLVTALEQVSRAVDGDLADKLGDAYGGMGSLRNLIRRFVQICPKEAPPPPPPPTPPPPPPAPEPTAAPEVATYAPQAAAPVEVATYVPEQAIAVSGDPGLSPESVVDEESAMLAIEQCGLILKRAGDALRVAAPESPLAYHYGRVGAWLELNRDPPSEDGVSLVPSPPDGLRERLAALAEAEEWPTLLAVADEILAEHIVWLDPLRYLALALERLGEEYEAAHTTLLYEVGIVLLRAPGLVTLNFNDGVPYADEETRAWIESDVKSVLGAGGGGGGPRPSRSANPLDAAITQAKVLVAEEQLPEALNLLTKAVAKLSAPPDVFRGKLALAKLCLDAGQLLVARAQLESLEALVQRHHLDEWSPAICAELYGALYLSYQRVSAYGEASPEDMSRERAVFQRLCQLDPSAAIAITAG